MKTKPRSHGKIEKGKKSEKPKIPWFAKLNIKKIISLIPIMTHSKGVRDRIQLPVHPSTTLIATMIREKYPSLFKIDLDVHRSMHYAGRQLFEYMYLNNEDKVRAGKQFRLAEMMDDVVSVSYDSNWLESFLGRLMEGYLSHGYGRFSRESIIAKIEETKELIPPELYSRCDNFIDDELDSPMIQARIKERLRKRDYRNRKKKLRVVG